MKFIDLFAGLGGFHVALRRLGHECVFSSEIDPSLQSLYEKNFGIVSHGDIRQIDTSHIPKHDILCAGFPCQPFSKAGLQLGLDCPLFGNLFDHVVEILVAKKPEYIILENVPNLAKHRLGETWRQMRTKLERIGYKIDEQRLSPHQFGIPQIRERIYVVGCRTGLNNFGWPEPTGHPIQPISQMLEDNPPDARRLSKQVTDCLNVWQKFVEQYPKDIDLPTYPIWSMEFGATYPYETKTPYSVGLQSLCWSKGSHGVELRELPRDQRMLGLPSHARTTTSKFPTWKIRFIRRNRELYQQNKKWIAKWLPEILSFPSSLQKLEWNCKGGDRDIWGHVIQFRASGVRVKRPNSSPSLVAMTTTQVPIIAWQQRYMTPRECARLQSLSELEHLPAITTRAFKALGNAINADVVELIAKKLLSQSAQTKKTQQRNKRNDVDEND